MFRRLVEFACGGVPVLFSLLPRWCVNGSLSLLFVNASLYMWQLLRTRVDLLKVTIYVY